MAYSWAALPPAMIGLLLNHVAREAASAHTLARYAAINKDWQYLFEQLTFRHLVIRPDDLSEFETIVSLNSDRRKWLRSLSFHDRADDGAHLGDGFKKPLLKHSPSQAVCSLLRLLEKWDPDANLRLALYLHTPTTRIRDKRKGTRSHQDAASLQSTNKPHQPEKADPGHIIGEILAVKGFSVQYKGKEVASTRTVMSLCSKLPGLEELCLQDLSHDNEYTKHFNIAEMTPKFPTTLKRLHILGQGGREPRCACRYLVSRLVWFGTTAPLEELSITTSENAAEEFFENARNMIPDSSTTGVLHWRALQSLTLTCSSLRPGARHAAANRLLHQAGMAALGLKNLRQLLLLSYNTGRLGEIDGLFEYVVKEEGKGVPTCFVSEHIRMGRLVTGIWRIVAWNSHRARLRFSTDVNPQPSVPTIQSLLGEHGESPFEELKYPRPHWTASERFQNFLGALAFFVALVMFLSFLVALTP